MSCCCCCRYNNVFAHQPKGKDGAYSVPLLEDDWDDEALGSSSHPESPKQWFDMFDVADYKGVVPNREVSAEDILLQGSEVYVAAVDGSRYPQLGPRKARSIGRSGQTEEEEAEEEEEVQGAWEVEGSEEEEYGQEEAQASEEGEEGQENEEEDMSQGDGGYGKSEEEEEAGEQVPYSDKTHWEEEEEPYQQAPHKGEQGKAHTPGNGQQQPYGAPGDKPAGVLFGCLMGPQ